MAKSSVVTWDSCDGLNHWDSILAVPDDMAVDVVNVALQRGQLGTKRPGCATVTTTGDSFSGVNYLGKFVPGQNLAAAELFIVSNDGTTMIIRVASSATAVNLSLSDAISTRPQDVCMASLNGKLFIAYDSPVNRMHMVSPTENPNAVNRVGLAAPVAPTVANTGSGTYAATLRYYRVQYRIKSGSTILRQSNLGPSLAFTPSGTGTAARVTKPATVSEGETHWVIYGSTDDAIYYELTEIVVGTTTYDDSALPSSYNTHPAAPIDGSFFPFPSTKFIVSDGTRLLGLGAWETTAGDSVQVKAGTLYWTPPLFSSEAGSTTGVGDDERTQSTVFQDDRLEMSVAAGGVDRGLIIFMNDVYVFQSKGIYKAVATGQATAPYRRVMISRDYGAVSNNSLIIGEDEAGNPALYFLDPSVGPCRYTVVNGVQWLGKDCNYIWQRVNLAATTVVAHGVYDRRYKRVMFWLALDSENEPTTNALVYHVNIGRRDASDGTVRRGWALWTSAAGGIASARHSLMFPTTLASSRPLTECPYLGNATVFQRNDGTVNTDSGTAYQAYITSKAHDYGILIRRKRLTEAFVTASAVAATEIRQTLTSDFGARSTYADVSIAPEAVGQTLIRAFVQATDLADFEALQVTLGDKTALNKTWTLHRWDGVMEVQEGAR